MVDVLFDEAWAVMGDLEDGFGVFQPDMRHVTVVDRDGEHVVADAPSRYGMRARLRGVLRPGWCWLQSQFVIIGMARDTVARRHNHPRGTDRWRTRPGPRRHSPARHPPGPATLADATRPRADPQLTGPLGCRGGGAGGGTGWAEPGRGGAGSGAGLEGAARPETGCPLPRLTVARLPGLRRQQIGR
ncbi:hypothetical protein ACU686_00565 [Yinghuangia aomiensis]